MKSCTLRYSNSNCSIWVIFVRQLETVNLTPTSPTCQLANLRAWDHAKFCIVHRYGHVTPLSHLLFRFFISSSFSLSSCSSWLPLGVSSSSSFSSWSSLVFFKASWYLYQTKHLFLSLGCCISMILFNEKLALCLVTCNKTQVAVLQHLNKSKN